MKNIVLFFSFLCALRLNAQMVIYGTTTGTCDCYQLTDELPTQAGSIWSPNSIDLTNSFDLTFSVNLGDIDAGGADGMVFVIRNVPGDPGGGGGGLGYDGILTSVGIEIDTWSNAENGDPAADHIGMNSNGLLTHSLAAPVSLPNVEDGLNHDFRVTWDPVSFELETFFEGVSIFVYTGDLTTLFFGGDPEVYFGWTAGTGGASNKQTVCSYRDVTFTTDHTDELMVTTACPNELINFIDGSTSDLIYDGVDIIEWSWDFGDGGTSTAENPSHAYLTTGTFIVELTVKDITGCFSVYTINVLIGGISIDVTVNEPTCVGFSDGSIVLNVPGGVVDPTFTISDSDGIVLNEDNSNVANELSSGWYYYLVEDDSGCGSALDSIFLDEPDQIDIDLTVTDPLCYGFETGWARVDEVFNYTGAEAGINYFWSPNPAGNNGIGADSTWSLGAGEYTLTINDANGCSRLFNFSVDQPDSLFFTEFGFDPAYCRIFDYQSGNGVVFGAVAGGTPDYNYSWENLETGETIDNTTWGGLNPANYLFTATDGNGCVKTGQVFLDSLNPIASFNVLSDQLNADLQGTAPVEVVFENTSENFANPNNPLADTTFFWNLNKPIAAWEFSDDYFETFDTTYGPLGQTYEAEVCLVAINKNGCTDTACKIITIYEPIAFANINIFSPNEDGKNDVFTFDLKSASIATFKCVIVNRWGDVIFEMDEVTDGWDGTTAGGSLCSAGVYFYTYEAVTDNSTKLTGQGTIQLVR